MESKVQREFRNTLGMTFISIDPGTFMMGSLEGEPGKYDDEMLHNVTLTNGFYMQITPVTVGQWRKFVDATDFLTQAEKEGGAYIWVDKKRERNSSIYWDNPGFEQTDAYSVTCITWNDIQKFIQWLNQKHEGEYRLPTEAEWEYACRAGTTTPFSCGSCLSTDHANYNGTYSQLPGCPNEKNRKKMLPAGSLEPNPWGLYDMHGNVYEWCQDKAEWDTEKSLIINNTTYLDGVKNPLCAKGSSQILRGGCWGADAIHCRSAVRLTHDPNDCFDYIGFRLVRS
ncbi:MAG: formylglycine-generating enzyme family protein [Candidatus Electrothrix aestuarii]|uniref:Formylglycine-generating enzyme family protein n=1 Tax=Candidatus Electrothrix aestuarii TaxID=3062594 RepID=A0AAU8LYU8_9BACT|nr:formylglycine-generating enzyme family protein [Candidatus Electrothrix aestuarii]